MRPRLTGIAELANFIDYRLYFFIFPFMPEELRYERDLAEYAEAREKENEIYDRF